MKKLLPVCLLLVLLSSCSRHTTPPKLDSDFTQKVSVEMGDYSYNAEIKLFNDAVYYTVLNTSAVGLTISCDDEFVTFSMKDYINKVEKENINITNPALVLYEIIKDYENVSYEYSDGQYIFTGFIEAGRYVLTLDEDGGFVSIRIDDISLDIHI